MVSLPRPIFVVGHSECPDGFWLSRENCIRCELRYKLFGQLKVLHLGEHRSDLLALPSALADKSCFPNLQLLTVAHANTLRDFVCDEVQMHRPHVQVRVDTPLGEQQLDAASAA